MSLNHRSNHQYYRPQTTSVSTSRNRPESTKLSIFHMFLYFFIGFFFMYVGLIYFIGLNTTEEKSDAIALDATPNPVTNQESETKNSIMTFFQGTQNTNTLGVNTKQDEELLKLIEEKIPKDNGEYAVVVKELGKSDNRQVFINHQKTLPAGSLYKLYVMAAALEKIEKGDMTMQTVVTAQADHLEQVLGAPDFGYEDRKGETISYTVEEILARIARISDNYASIMLAEKLNNWEDVRDYARRFGAPSTSIKSPISTNAQDIAYFFDQLYQRKVVSEVASNKLIDLLATAQLNQRIPAKLPKSGLKIAHKTGELPRVRNDAGIVFFENEDDEATKSATPQKAYLIVLMSNELKGEDSGVTALAEISKVVYDYFK